MQKQTGVFIKTPCRRSLFMKTFFIFQQRPFQIFLAFLFTGLISACQTPQEPPAPPQKGLTEQQVQALVEVGFTETDEGWELNIGERILFGSALDALDAAGQAKIRRLADTFQKIGITRLIVEGHTDNTGSKQYNDRLAQRRAASIATVLDENGIPYDSITQRSFGSTRPVADNATAEGRMQNRRVVIIVPVE